MRRAYDLVQGLGPTIFSRGIQIDIVAYGSWIRPGKTGTDYYSSGNELLWLGQTPCSMPIQLTEWGGAAAQVRGLSFLPQRANHRYTSRRHERVS